MAESRPRSSLVAGVVAGTVCTAFVLLLTTMVLAARPGPVEVGAQAVAPVVPVRPVAEASRPAASGRHADPSWVASMSQLTGIGDVAVQAYGDMALRLATEQPACRLGWTTLAGIGGVESGHGTTDGTVLEPDGTTSRPILGPALDGTGGTARIRSDAASVQWHGDVRWDHAVGPMQFIPSTWERWGSDGNDDGRADPHNIQDAAYTTARYLCASGDDLSTGVGWTRAIFSYNHSADYVRSVLARADRYAAAR